MLQRCEGLWGEANLMYGDPPQREVSDAYYLPFTADGPWGIYDRNRRIVEESVDYRGPERRPHPTTTEWPADISHAAEAPDALYIYCGRVNPHFGHFLINSLPRFWPFLRARERRATLLCAEPPGDMLPFAVDILSKLGITARDFVSFPVPTRLPRVIVPAPCLWEQYWAYTLFKDLCGRVAEGMYEREKVDSVSRPAYISKSRLAGGVGRFLNEDRIEARLSRAGIDIVHPQTLSFRDQVRLLSSRRICVGPTGSAFHTSIFAAARRQFVCLNPAREVNSNFVLIDKLNNNRSTYFYQGGMEYAHSGTFLTEVRLADVDRAADDLIGAIEEATGWRSS